MAKKINMGILKIWLDRTRADIAFLNLIMLIYITIKSGFVIEWWHIVLFVLFNIIRTYLDHKKIMPQQIDFWLRQSRILMDLKKKVDKLHEDSISS